MKKHHESPDTLQTLAGDISTVGDRNALLAFDGDDVIRWRYQELAEAVDRCARDLERKGIGRQDRVIVCGANSVGWIVAFLGVLRCGASAVPVDAQFADDTIEHVVRDSGARLVFAGEPDRFKEICREIDIDIERLSTPETKTRANNGKEPGTGFPRANADEEAVLAYTSGTTGKPKGVPLTHKNLVYQLETIARSGLVEIDDRMLLPLPMHHIYPLVIGILVPLGMGMSVVLPEGFTGTKLLNALRRGDVTLMLGVPRLYDAMIEGLKARFDKRGILGKGIYTVGIATLRGLRRRLGWRLGRLMLAPMHRRLSPSLRTVISGGSALTPDTAWTLEALGWNVGTGYGLTETAPLLTINPPGSGRFESAGRPVEGVEIKIDRQGEETEDGEVLVRGPGVFTGYLNRQEESDKAFSEDGWFRTGDLGHMDSDGYLHLAGRKSTLIVTQGGKNVQPDEIEAAYGAHPAIAEIAVLESDGDIKGLIVLDPKARRNDNARIKADEAVREISKDLPSYQRLAEFRVTREKLPRTRLGKPRRHLIEERYRQAEEGEEENPDTGPVDINRLDSEDRGLLEDDKARAVFDLIVDQAKASRVTPDSDLLLDLDIDSIAWLDLSLAISERVGITFSEEAIGEINTVRDLLQQVVDGDNDVGTRINDALRNPEDALDESQRRWLEQPSSFARFFLSFSALINYAIMRGVFRLRVSGQENLPTEGPFVITPNHASYLDPFALAAALGRKRIDDLCWAGWTGVAFSGPVRRAAARAARVLPIDPAGAPASSLALGCAALKRGVNLVWFPEGERSQDGKLKQFRPGIGLILEHQPVPIVPVLIQGTHAAWPPTRRLPKFKPVRVSFLPPADPPQLIEEGEGNRDAEKTVNALRARIEAAHSEMSA